MAEPARQLDSDESDERSQSRSERKAQWKANSPSSNSDIEAGKSEADLQSVPNASTSPSREEDDPGKPKSGGKTSSGKPDLKVVQGGKGESDGASGAASSAASSAASHPPTSTTGAAVFAARMAAVAAGAKKNKKGIAAGSGVVGILFLMVFLFTAVAGLKIEAMMKNVIAKHFGFEQHFVEKRVIKIFENYALNDSEASEKPVVATGHLLGDLYRTWRVRGFESDLADKYGLKLESTGVKGHIKISSPEGTEEFDDLGKLDQYMDQDLGPKAAAQFISDAVGQETQWWQFVQRSHLRRWMRIAYGINTWEILHDNPDQDKGESSGQEMTDVNTSIEGVEDNQYATELAQDVPCLLDGAGCPDGTEPDATVPAATAEGDAAGEAIQSGVKDALNKIPGVQNATNAVTESAIYQLIENIIGSDVSKAIITKAVPVIGWVDLAAHLDNFIWNGRLNAMIKHIREVQYAAVFASWAIIADQIKEGTATAPAVNAALTKMNGMEDSSAYCADFLGKTTNCGTGPDPDKMFSNSYVTAWTDLYKVVNLPTHLALVTYLDTIGKIYDLVQAGIGWAINFILNLVFTAFPPLGDMVHWVLGTVTHGLMWIFMHVLGPVVAATDDGLTIMNAVDIGGDVTSNDFCANVLGCPAVTTAQAYETQQDQIAMVNREQTPSMYDRVFSVDYPGSFISRLAVILPSSPLLAVKDSFTSLMAVVSDPFQISSNGLQFAFEMATPEAAAAQPQDPYGVDQYGYTNAELNQPITDDSANLDAAEATAAAQGRNVDQVVPSDCPQVPVGQENMCELDVTAITSLKANFTTTDDGGIDSNGD